MSNQVIHNAPVVFIAKPLSVALKACSLDGLTSAVVPFSDNERVTASMIPMTKDGAAVCMGAQCTPKTFTVGLAYLTAGFAYGQGKLDALCNGLPEVAAYALQRACSRVKRGAGISARDLKTALVLAIEETAALPVRTRTKAITKADTPAIDGQSTRIADETADKVETVETADTADTADKLKLLASYADGAVNRDADPQDELAANAALDAENQKAIDKEKARAEGEARALARMAAENETAELKRIAFCRLADYFGIKLTKAQLALMERVA